jgi:hypothetical protein
MRRAIRAYATHPTLDLEVTTWAPRINRSSSDDADHTFSYSIDEGPPPISSADISDYMGRVTVKATPDGSGSMVEWSSSWQDNDEAAYEFCHPIYMALLADMKASLEGA